MAHHYLKRFGFTLPEVLITLGIIGVVAALTIPHFLAKTFERECVEKFKQTYSILDNAIRAMQMEEGCEGSRCFSTVVRPDILSITDKLEKYFKYSDKHYKKNGTWGAKVAWLPEVGYGLSGYSNDYATLGVHSHVTSDNSDICIYRLNNSSTVAIFRMNAFDNSGILNVTIDVNGKSGPNRVGKDVFPVSTNINGPGLTPYHNVHSWAAPGYNEGLCRNTVGQCDPDEKSPAAYVLVHNKLPDLTKLGYPAKP